MRVLEFEIEGMTCDGCVRTVQKVLEKAGAKDVSVQIGHARFVAEGDPESFRKAVERVGYTVVGIKGADR